MDWQGGLEVQAGYLYASFSDPGAVWEFTSASGGTVKLEGAFEHASRIARGAELTRVEGEIAWYVFDVSRSQGGTQISMDIDYMMSMYQTYKEYIQSNFTDDALNANMSKLHELTDKAIGNIAQGYANETGNFLAQYGFEGEQDTLKASIVNYFWESLSAKQGVSPADYGISVSENGSGNLYSMDDIHALIYMQLATERHHYDPYDTREEYPANYFSYAMKKESIYNTFSVGDSAKNMIETVFTSRINSLIDERNKANAQALALHNVYDISGVSEETRARLAPFDKEAVWQVINSFMESTRSGLSYLDSMEKIGLLNAFYKTNSVGDFNEFFTQLGRVSQMENLDWTKSREWVV